MTAKSFIGAAIILSLGLMSGQAHAFRSTDFQSYTDPDFKDYQPSKALLVVDGGSFEIRKQIEERMTREFARRGVTLIPVREFFPPTRKWTAEEQLRLIQENAIDSRLIVTVGASASAIIPVATQTYGSASVYGSVNSTGSFNASGNSSSTSYTIFSAHSKAEFSAVLLENSSNRVAWYADLLIKASGTLFVSEKGDAKGLVKGVVEALEDDGHLNKH